VGDSGWQHGVSRLLHQVQAVFSNVAPCQRGASPVSMRGQTSTTGLPVKLRPVPDGARDAR
jgi:hypothetical protein